MSGSGAHAERAQTTLRAGRGRLRLRARRQPCKRELDHRDLEPVADPAPQLERLFESGDRVRRMLRRESGELERLGDHVRVVSRAGQLASSSGAGGGADAIAARERDPAVDDHRLRLFHASVRGCSLRESRCRRRVLVHQHPRQAMECGRERQHVSDLLRAAHGALVRCARQREVASRAVHVTHPELRVTVEPRALGQQIERGGVVPRCRVEPAEQDVRPAAVEEGVSRVTHAASLGESNGCVEVLERLPGPPLRDEPGPLVAVRANHEQGVADGLGRSEPCFDVPDEAVLAGVRRDEARGRVSGRQCARAAGRLRQGAGMRRKALRLLERAEPAVRARRPCRHDRVVFGSGLSRRRARGDCEHAVEVAQQILRDHHSPREPRRDASAAGGSALERRDGASAVASSEQGLAEQRVDLRGAQLGRKPVAVAHDDAGVARGQDRLPFVSEDTRDVLRTRGRVPARQCFDRRAVGLEPGRSALVQPSLLLRGQGRRSSGVVAYERVEGQRAPAAGDEEPSSEQPFDRRGGRAQSERFAQADAEALKGQHGGDERPHGLRRGAEDLRRQIREQRAARLAQAKQLLRAAGRRKRPQHLERKAYGGRPAAGKVVDLLCDRFVGSQRRARETGDLVRGERELVRADLEQLSAPPEALDLERKRVPRRHDEVQPCGGVAGDALDQTETRRRRLELVRVVEGADQIDGEPGIERVPHEGADPLRGRDVVAGARDGHREVLPPRGQVLAQARHEPRRERGQRTVALGQIESRRDEIAAPRVEQRGLPEAGTRRQEGEAPTERLVEAALQSRPLENRLELRRTHDSRRRRR